MSTSELRSRSCYFFVAIYLVVFVRKIRAGSDDDDSNGCPQLANANCRVDCSSDMVWDFICVDNVEWPALHDDLQKVAGRNHFMNLNLWNLNNTRIQLESNLFGSAIDRIQRLNLMNVTGLQTFPMLRDAVQLKYLTVIGAPNLKDFSAALLPDAVITSIRLFDTGITRLENDFLERANATSVRIFQIQGANFTYIQPNFFSVFPGLQALSVSMNTFSLESMEEEMFTTSTPLKEFVFQKNDFSGMAANDRNGFMKKLLESINVAEKSTVDLSDNKLPVNGDTVDSLSHIKHIAELDMQGNPFETSMTISDVFVEFTKVRFLDLSNTDLPISRGTFRGLSILDTLKMNNNFFKDMTAVDMFKGTASTILRVLDLSFNFLVSLPEGDLESVAYFVEELDLSGNNLNPVEFVQDNDADVTVNASLPLKPTFLAFPALKYLGLSYNNWTMFDATLLQPLTHLEGVDLSCNRFAYITKDFFDDMPRTLQSINMTMCLSELDDPPVVDDDAFSALPPVKTLILAKGSFRNWIFSRLNQMSNESLLALENIFLQDNNIRFLNPDLLRGFPVLKTLNLRGNTLQSLGDSSFRNLGVLTTLILSYNQLINIDANDFSGLASLKKLDLRGNRIAHIDGGSFDDLTSLTHLYLGDNHLTSLDSLFVKGGGALLHLGLQRNPMPCITRSDLEPLSSLRWLYMFDVTTPIFISMNDGSNLPNEVYVEPFQAGDNLNCDLRFESGVFDAGAPEGDSDYRRFDSDFVRLPMDNPWDLTIRSFTAHLAKCYIPDPRNLTLMTHNLLCAMSDQKTDTSSGTSPRLSIILLLLLIFSILSTIRNI